MRLLLIERLEVIIILSKYAPKRENKLINESDIQEMIKLIPGTDDYYAGYNGRIYRKYTKDKYHPISSRILDCGYEYVTLTINGKHKSFRVHRLIAITFIHNPDNLPIVGHKDNNKVNNCVNNLYWTTYSENSKKAVDDGLLVNVKGYDDSQSHPVICYNQSHKEIARYGSICEAHRMTGVSKSTVTRHCKGQIISKTRSGHYFDYQ